jgi:hypothetical protein
MTVALLTPLQHGQQTPLHLLILYLHLTADVLHLLLLLHLAMGCHLWLGLRVPSANPPGGC